MTIALQLLNTQNGTGAAEGDADFVSFSGLPTTFHVFEGGTATVELFGKIVGDPTLELVAIRLAPTNPDGSPSQGFVGVAIDIKPGSEPNCIKATSEGLLSVAILGNSIDVTTVDVGTIQIDDDRDPATVGVVPVRSSVKDMDGDGKTDLVLHFSTPAFNTAGLLVDGNTLFLTGTLTNGTPIQGSDEIFLAGGPECFD